MRWDPYELASERVIVFASPPLFCRALIAIVFVVAGCLSLAMPHLQAGQPCHAQYTQHDENRDDGRDAIEIGDAICIMHCTGTAILLTAPTMPETPLWRGAIALAYDTASSTIYRLDRPPKTFS